MSMVHASVMLFLLNISINITTFSIFFKDPERNRSVSDQLFSVSCLEGQTNHHFCGYLKFMSRGFLSLITTCDTFFQDPERCKSVVEHLFSASVIER